MVINSYYVHKLDYSGTPSEEDIPWIREFIRITGWGGNESPEETGKHISDMGYDNCTIGVLKEYIRRIRPPAGHYVPNREKLLSLVKNVRDVLKLGSKYQDRDEKIVDILMSEHIEIWYDSFKRPHVEMWHIPKINESRIKGNVYD